MSNEKSPMILAVFSKITSMGRALISAKEQLRGLICKESTRGMPLLLSQTKALNNVSENYKKKDVSAVNKDDFL